MWQYSSSMLDTRLLSSKDKCFPLVNRMRGIVLFTNYFDLSQCHFCEAEKEAFIVLKHNIYTMKDLASKYTAVRTFNFGWEWAHKNLVDMGQMKYHKKHVRLTFGRICPSSELSGRTTWNVSWLQFDSSQLLWYKITMAITPFWLVIVLSPKSLPGIVSIIIIQTTITLKLLFACHYCIEC